MELIEGRPSQRHRRVTRPRKKPAATRIRAVKTRQASGDEVIRNMEILVLFDQYNPVNVVRTSRGKAFWASKVLS